MTTNDQWAAAIQGLQEASATARKRAAEFVSAVTGEPIRVPMTDTERGAAALDLWREWLKKDGEPWYMTGYGDILCIFCFHNKHRGHASDCIYIRARALVEDTNGE